MAIGVRKKCHSDIGLSTTGIAGPNGGSKKKPVGLVFIGLVTPTNSLVKKFYFNFSRNLNREVTASAAFNITRLEIEK